MQISITLHPIRARYYLLHCLHIYLLDSRKLTLFTYLYWTFEHNSRVYLHTPFLALVESAQWPTVLNLPHVFDFVFTLLESLVRSSYNSFTSVCRSISISCAFLGGFCLLPKYLSINSLSSCPHSDFPSVVEPSDASSQSEMLLSASAWGSSLGSFPGMHHPAVADMVCTMV